MMDERTYKNIYEYWKPLFRQYMLDHFPELEARIAEYFSGAFYVARHEDELDMDFQQILTDRKIPDNFVEKLEKHFKDNTNRKTPHSDAGSYKYVLELLLGCINENRNQQIVTPKSNNTKQQSTQDDKHEIIITTLKKFNLMLPVLPEYIGNILQEQDKENWWQKYVIGKLPDTITRDLPKTITNDEGIKKLDISACLKIIIQNWHNIFKHRMKKVKISYVHELLEIRNDLSHLTIEKLSAYTNEDIKRALDTMKIFIRPIIDYSEKTP